MNSTINRILNIQKMNKHLIPKTLLQKNQRLSEKYNCNVFLKREDLHKVRSFKIRGAYNKINKLSDTNKKKGIVCASAGNHAQGVSYSCKELDIYSDIFVPENTPLQKIASIRKFSNKKSNLHIVGENFNKCLKKSLEFSRNNGTIYVHPFDDQDIIDGQGTIASEIYEDISPDMIVGCIGGGGLMSGISLFSKNMNPKCQLIGVESDQCNAMYQSIKSGRVIELDQYDTFVDGTAVKTVSELTYNICNKYLDDLLLISNGKLSHTMLDLYQNDGIITEPAGALSISALDLLDPNKIANKNIVAIISGGNNDITRYPEIHELALRYANLKHYFIIQFVQSPGQLKKFVNNILGENDDITRFEYIKKTNQTHGQVLVGIQLYNPDNLILVLDNLRQNNFNFKYINDDDLLMSYLV